MVGLLPASNVNGRSPLPKTKVGPKVPIQFTSHAGFGCRIYKQLSAGYRFQHMSNASISRHNPGLDLHMCELSYRF